MEDDVRQSSADRYAVSQAYRWRAERDKAMQELRQLKKEVEGRLMPEGMEWLLDVWPKWDNGDYCKFGDWWTAESYGEFEPKQLRKLSIYTPEQLDEFGQGNGKDYGYEWDFFRPKYVTYHPVKVEPPAPIALDADGVEVEVGDDLYSVEGMLKFHVSAIDKKNGRIATEAMFALDKWADPKMYTHRAPVIAADGRPLREGETVWNVKTGERYVVGAFASGCVNVSDGRGGGLQLLPSQLTHERPESWERLEDDATVSPETYCVRRGIDIADVDGTHLVLDDVTELMARDLVRRAKTLAERGE